MKIEAIFAFLMCQNQAPGKHQLVTEFTKMLSTTNARFEFAGAYKKKRVIGIAYRTDTSPNRSHVTTT